MSLKSSLLLLSPLLIVGCNAIPSPMPAPSTGLPPGGATSHVIEGVASLGLPLAHAAVEVSSFSGTSLFSTTYNTGAFDIMATTRPQHFVVSATGTFGGEAITLRAEALDNEGEPLRLNVISSLVSAYHTQHPGQSLIQSEQAIKRLLELPTRLNLRRNISSTHFDPQVFLSQARQSGGVNAYISWLAAQADSNQHYPFRPPRVALSGQSISTGVSVIGKILAGISEGLDVGETAGLGIILGSVAEALGDGSSDGSSEAKLEAISTQLDQLETQLEDIDSQLNTLQGSLAADTTKIDSDVNYQAYNAAYNRQLSSDIEDTTWVVNRLSGILNTARSAHPNLPALQIKMNTVKTFIAAHFGVSAADGGGTLQMDQWKDQLISNGFGTSGVVQNWSHYVASRSPIYNAKSAQAVQDQWDFLDAQWLLYVLVQLEGLNEQPSSSHQAARQALLQAWATDRKSVVGKLLGGTKQAAELNAGLSISGAPYAGINTVLAQSQPTPFPANALYLQADHTLWWLKMAFDQDTSTSQVGYYGVFGLSPALFETATTEATNAAAQQMGPGAWTVPGPSSYANLQAALDQLGEEFGDEHFDTANASGKSRLLIPMSSANRIITSGSDFVDDNMLYVYDPSKFLRTLPYRSHDAINRIEYGCPTLDPTWNTSTNLSLQGNSYSLYSAYADDMGFFGTDTYYSYGLAVQNGEYAGCSGVGGLNESVAMFVNRALAIGEQYWY